ncbi:MAG: tol-pal system protein YbgF [Nitrospirae bacterium]|nr:MAG: tol-pal system protein YbgF [Nitrospirota bacterium]
MKRALAIIGCLLVFGCATPGGAPHTLRTDLNQVMLTQKEIKKELKALKEEVENLKNSISPPEKSEMVLALRDAQLSMQAQLQQLTQTLQSIQASIEELTFKMDSNRKDTEAEIEALRANIETLNNELNNLRARVETSVVTPQTVQPEETTHAPSEQPSAKGPEAMYKEALQLFNQGKIREARERFEAFIRMYPEHELADNCQFWIGETYYKEGNYEEAILAYENLLKKYPNSNKLPEAMLKQAYSFANIGDINTARVILKALLKKFPDSDMASYAEKKLKELGE